MDLPTHSYNTTYATTPADDSSFYGPGGSHNTPEERGRLAALLGEMPTSEEEDAALLEGGGWWGWVRGSGLKGWRQRTVVEMRLARKRALKRAIALIDAELGEGEGGRAGETAAEL